MKDDDSSVKLSDGPFRPRSTSTWLMALKDEKRTSDARQWSHSSSSGQRTGAGVGG